MRYRGLVTVLLGLFVGGQSRRMGGRAKGLLTLPDGTRLVDRALDVGRAAGLAPVLVGMTAGYEDLGVEALVDEPPGIGPLGGLTALLRRALASNARQAIALACDMPFVTRELLERLAGDPSPASILAPRRERWEPLCARYDAARVLALIEGRRAESASLQRLLDAAAAEPFPLSEGEAASLRDWDTPADVEADGGRPVTR